MKRKYFEVGLKEDQNIKVFFICAHFIPVYSPGHLKLVGYFRSNFCITIDLFNKHSNLFVRALIICLRHIFL